MQSQCHTGESHVRTMEISMNNLEGNPLDEPIMGPSVISGGGCIGRERPRGGTTNSYNRDT